jgi:hypothetical protein
MNHVCGKLEVRARFWSKKPKGRHGRNMKGKLRNLDADGRTILKRIVREMGYGISKEDSS